MHHAILNALNLKSPRSVIVQPGVDKKVMVTDLTFPLLFKPNAGGFGEGIR